MSRLVFNSNEVQKSEDPIIIGFPDEYKKYQKTDELTEFELDNNKKIEGYEGPSIEDIDLEIKKYKEEAEKEIKEKLEKAKIESQHIIEQSKVESEKLINISKENLKKEEENALFKSQQIIDRAKLESERIIKEAELKVSEIEKQSYEKGYNAGNELGYADGKKEISRIVDRLGTILGHATDVRNQIIKESEKQMVEIILMIARKIIKDEISERKDIVLNNIQEALTHVKDREHIDIRVNFSDLELTTSYKDKIMRMVNSLNKVNIYEDSRIDRGGVIIETNIGSIDARIFTQLNCIEEAIKNISPF